MDSDSSSRGERVELPSDFADHIATVSSLETPPATWAEWWGTAAEPFAETDRTLDLSDLYKDEQTPHEVHVDGHVRYARCAADALTAAVMEGQSTVTVRSIDPVTGTPVQVEVTNERVDVSPEAALVCFGARINREDVESAGSLGDWALQDDKTTVEAAVCQHTFAFESEATYEQWASQTEAFTAPIPPARFVELARQLTDTLG